MRTLRRSIDMDILPELLGYNVRCAQLALQRSFVRTMGSSEIGTGVFGLLVLAGANPGIAQIQVATHLNVDKASVVSMVDKLEETGWLVRRRALDDRRRYGLFLTAEGTRQLKLLEDADAGAGAIARRAVFRRGASSAHRAAAADAAVTAAAAPRGRRFTAPAPTRCRRAARPRSRRFPR